MPGGDRTGPMGMGPMTCRGAGFCAGNPYPGAQNPGQGFTGRGRRCRSAGWGGAARGFEHPGGPGAARAYGRRMPFANLGFGLHLPSRSVPFQGQRAAGASLDVLKVQANQMQELLNDLRARIGELESTKPRESNV
jgi:hypothetical protein